jgi:hypothetical protein
MHYTLYIIIYTMHYTLYTIIYTMHCTLYVICKSIDTLTIIISFTLNQFMGDLQVALQLVSLFN